MGIINLILGSSGAGATTGATGGNSISYAPGPGGPTHYAVHKFTASGSLVVNTVGPGAAFEYIVVGSGGGGSGDSLGSGTPQGRGGGGGGAGGFRSNLPEGPGGPSPTAEAAYPIVVGTYPVVVGGGGAGGPANNAPMFAAQPGTFSSFGVAPQTVIRSEGGGATGQAHPNELTAGGCGGGASWYTQSGPQAGGTGNRVSQRDGGGTTSPAPNQGYPGGSGRTDGNQGKGGGGGGAEAVGESAQQNASDTYGAGYGGDGGEGRATLIFGPTTGPTNQICGGGGGSRGGEGVYGGGPGPSDGPGTDATASTGSGGGACGGGLSAGNKAGGNGAGGLVVIRYAQGS